MFLRIAAIAVVILAVSSCELLDTSAEQNKATITRRLYDLHIALESYTPSDSTATAAQTSTTNGAEDTNGHPVDTSSEQHTRIQDESGTTASIVAVVDSVFLTQGVAGEEVDPAARNSAMHRERLVRQAINASLVKNKLIHMIPPTTVERDRIRQVLITTNNSVMAPADAITAGEAIGVQHLIWAVIENEGQDVNIIAQQVDNGRVVYDETLSSWDIFVVPEESAEE